MTALMLLLSMLATEAAPLPQDDSERELVQLLLTHPLRGQWTAACRGRVVPDRVLVVGGVSARSLAPSAARDQIETQLEVIRSFVGQNGGTLELLGTVLAGKTRIAQVLRRGGAAYGTHDALAPRAPQFPVRDLDGLGQIRARLGFPDTGGDLVADDLDGAVPSFIEAFGMSFDADRLEEAPAGSRRNQKSGRHREARRDQLTEIRPFAPGHWNVAPPHLVQPPDQLAHARLAARGRE